MARGRGGEAAETTGLERKPYGRLSRTQWAEVRALFARGVTARALSEAFGPAERTIYAHLKRHDCLRKDEAEAGCVLTPEALDEKARAVKGSPAEAPCNGLGGEASLAEAARAAARTAILMLGELQPTRAYTYARLAGTLERLARGVTGMAGDGSADEAGMARGRQAALDFLRARRGVASEGEEVTGG
ncbi:hypothetical protein [Brevundimonas sp. GCM10030266]|uniref:hypothetical protein n=1 Tax=Brevundimonas sp. GCM10030266 TaxID=3273386 RepID=UPI00360B3569